MWALLLVVWAAIAIYLDWRRSGLTGWEYAILRVAHGYSHLWHRWSTNSRMPFPLHGPILVVPNHTCSADPNFLLGGSQRPMSFLVAQAHYDIHPFCRKILDELQCVPVHRAGRDVVAAREGLRRLQAGRAVCVFPEGNLSGIERNQLLSPRLGAAWLALKSRVPVYPVLIQGGPRTDELLDSWVFPSAKAVRVTFGRPLDLSAYYGRPITRKLLQEVTERIMAGVQALNGRSNQQNRK